LTDQNQLAILHEEVRKTLRRSAEVVVVASDQVLDLLALHQRFECDLLCTGDGSRKQGRSDQQQPSPEAACGILQVLLLPFSMAHRIAWQQRDNPDATRVPSSSAPAA